MVQVRRWDAVQQPTEEQLRQLMHVEGLRPYAWSNGPGVRYPAHEHSYAKVLYVVSGSLRFGLPASGEQLELRPGDRLELPAGTPHDALVGPEGVVCLEAQA